jgi:hypothetical protein
MAASDFVSCTNFGANQIPEAVVAGYGFPDGSSQPFELQVVQTPYETVVFTNLGTAFAGKVTLIDLPVRDVGNYQARLLINDSVRDAWNFTLTHAIVAANEVRSSAPAGSVAEVKSDIEVVVAPWGGGDIFSDYDAAFGAALNAAINASVKTNRDIFAQAMPGHVAIRFDMDEKGQVSSPEIIGNTLGEAQGQFFLQVLVGGSPYKPWSAAAKTVYGDHPRNMKVTFHLD